MIMKKLIMATSIAVFLSLAASASNKHKLSVSYAVRQNFSGEFPSVKNASWSEDKGYMVATFMQDDAVTKAYFNYDGDPVATVKEMSFTDLPASVQNEIQKKYSDYTTLQTVQFTDNDSYTESSVFDVPDEDAKYFVSMAKDNKELIVQVNANDEISFFEKMKE